MMVDPMLDDDAKAALDRAQLLLDDDGRSDAGAAADRARSRR
jgi:hypothetical protein